VSQLFHLCPERVFLLGNSCRLFLTLVDQFSGHAPGRLGRAAVHLDWPRQPCSTCEASAMGAATGEWSCARGSGCCAGRSDPDRHAL